MTSCVNRATSPDTGEKGEAGRGARPPPSSPFFFWLVGVFYFFIFLLIWGPLLPLGGGHLFFLWVGVGEPRFAVTAGIQPRWIGGDPGDNASTRTVFRLRSAIPTTLVLVSGAWRRVEFRPTRRSPLNSVGQTVSFDGAWQKDETFWTARVPI